MNPINRKSTLANKFIWQPTAILHIMYFIYLGIWTIFRSMFWLTAISPSWSLIPANDAESKKSEYQIKGSLFDSIIACSARHHNTFTTSKHNLNGKYTHDGLGLYTVRDGQSIWMREQFLTKSKCSKLHEYLMFYIFSF